MEPILHTQATKGVNLMRSEAASLQFRNCHFAIMVALLLGNSAYAADLGSADTILKTSCAECHGEDKAESGFDIRSLDSILKGGSQGPGIAPGKPEKSLLIEMIENGEMPPEGHRPISEKEVSTLKAWIGSLSEDLRPVDSAETEQHWIFSPPVEPEIPVVTHQDSVRNPIDQFVLAQLETKGLTINANAAPDLLIRRLYFDLTGLPPTPKQTTRFVNDHSSQAYEDIVDELLDSPRYGERWGRHWLDIAGYADSACASEPGFDMDRSHAWRYRDYVINAFNKDTPYDQFLIEQIAGDEIVDWRNAPTYTEKISRSLIATGFMRCAQDCTREVIDDPLVEMQFRHEARMESFETIVNAVLGVNLHCARCHNHRHDPITQVEYYEMLALFAPAYDTDNWLPGMPYDISEEPGHRYIVGAGREDAAKLGEANHKTEVELTELKDELARLDKKFRAELRQEKLQKLSLEEHERINFLANQDPEVLDEESAQELADFEMQFSFTMGTLTKKSPEFSKHYSRLMARIREVQKQRPVEVPYYRALWDVNQNPQVHLLRRGDFRKPGVAVEPGMAASLNIPASPFRMVDSKSADTTFRRLSFAEFVTQPDHPLTSRVYVNRVWQHHFGRGIIETSGDIGLGGSKPTHPELLDWLAHYFTKQGWSIKKLHRLIVCSNVYKQSSQFQPSAAELDPEAKLLWRWTPRRLEGEAIRDSILSVTGDLNLEMGGEPIATEQSDDGQFVITTDGSSENRRSIYVRQRRSQPLWFLEVFDTPRMVTNCSRRHHSVTPLQSLTLLNSTFVLDSSEKLASRVRQEAGDDANAQIKLSFQMVLGRSPSEVERTRVREFLTSSNGDSAALADFCHALIASNEFIYIP